MAGKTVAVTGANGFIASWVVKLLLERGYTVRGTVRDPDDSSKVGHLLEMPGAKERLTLHKADLLEEGAFDDIFYGVDGVFHIASPATLENVPDVEKDLLLPAVKGTINVLSSTAKAKTVKRVALTSSNAAVSFCEAGFNPKDPNVIVDESWWSDQEWCTKKKMWYALSKTQAEQAAWHFVKDKEFDLVVLNPTGVVGPILQSSINASSEVLLHFLDGSMKEYPNRMIGIVHVRDVAMAHILAYENPSAEGRYFLAAKGFNAPQFIDLLRALCPGCRIPEKCVSDPQIPTIYVADKIKTLGLVYTPAEEAVKECIADLRERNLLKC